MSSGSSILGKRNSGEVIKGKIVDDDDLQIIDKPV